HVFSGNGGLHKIQTPLHMMGNSRQMGGGKNRVCQGNHAPFFGKTARRGLPGVLDLRSSAVVMEKYFDRQAAKSCLYQM
ncbi:MAG: hypothetical protein MRZ98_08365, partial [Clostridiales bacterium]|nr:hypothetical protein [Clostridiales bacterium]